MMINQKDMEKITMVSEMLHLMSFLDADGLTTEHASSTIYYLAEMLGGVVERLSGIEE